YALASYYDASKDEQALKIAQELYHIVETKCKDEYGYLEAFNIRFEPAENDKLSENGVMAEKTMNTLLHVFEAYTELYRVTHDGKVADNIRYMLDLVADKVYNSKIGRQEVFFDRTWNTLIDLYSYGHDIETSWLIDRGLEILGDDAYTAKLSPITKTITENIYKRAYIDHSLVNEAENGVVDTTRIWWVQAEAVVGFLNGYQKSPEHKEYLEAAEDIWGYIRDYLVDKRCSEWYWALDENRKPLEKPIVEPWKCPYHNGRMCFEVEKRLKNL
ncbi:MAG: AGE family epimerase/isomerase, partial [Lachnospiraceae bacterium]|nr:AGE family epimerase/isomerase [Lachnospiraceae bacterium]